MTSPHALDARLARTAQSQHGLVTRAQAERLGLDRRAVRRRLAAGLLDEPRPGVLRLPGVEGWPQTILAVVLGAQPSVVASHRASAALHELDGCEPGALEVTSERRIRLPGVVAHRGALSPSDRRMVGGVPSTGLARTLADLGSVVPAHLVERAFEDVRRRGVSLTWLRRTAERLHRPGQRGTGVLLELLDGVTGPAADSWFEVLVERCLRSPRLPPLERQYVVRDQRGRFVARVDVAMPTIRLAIEAHSRRFHFGRAAETADERRDLRLAAVGWEVLYVGWHDLSAVDHLVDVVEATVAARSRSPVS